MAVFQIKYKIDCIRSLGQLSSSFSLEEMTRCLLGYWHSFKYSEFSVRYSCYCRVRMELITENQSDYRYRFRYQFSFTSSTRERICLFSILVVHFGSLHKTIDLFTIFKVVIRLYLNTMEFSWLVQIFSTFRVIFRIQKPSSLPCTQQSIYTPRHCS